MTTRSFLASAADMEHFIASVVATADHVPRCMARPGGSRSASTSGTSGSRPAASPARRPVTEAPPLIEDVYDIHDAVVVGSLLITLLRHTDRVAIACLAQLVNVIAPIMTEPGGPAWRQTIFHPFALTARYARGTVLQTPVSGPTLTTDRYGEVDQLHARGHLGRGRPARSTVFAVNRSLTDAVDLELDLAASRATWRIAEHLMLAEDDPRPTNTKDQPDRVRPRPGAATLRQRRC